MKKVHAPDLLIRVVADHTTDNPAAAIFSSRPTESLPGSASSFARIREWLASCDHSHRDCKKDRSYPPLQLIDVGENEDFRPRLCYWREFPDGVRYVCLSYCWGGKQNTVLMQDNIATWSSPAGLPMQKLPRTLLDAIAVVRATGHRYLWIDSLCLAQDINVRVEVQTMYQVFNGASFTILAARAESSQEGFLHPRDTREKVESRTAIVVRIEPRSEPFASSREITGSIVLSNTRPISLSCRDRPEPVETRAWIFQEHLLSRRVLSFGTQLTFWRCEEGTQSDTGCRTPPFRSTVANTFWHSRRELEKRWNTGFRDVEYASLAWDGLLEEYSDLLSSLHTDRIRALAGMADYFRKFFLCSYHSGLWVSGLPAALLWRLCDTPTKGENRSQVAPSWSWMHVSGKIICPAEYTEGRLAVVRISVQF